MYEKAIKCSALAFGFHRIELDESGKPIDYVFLDVNAAFERMTGLSRESVLGKRVSEVIPGIHDDGFDWAKEYGAIALGGAEKHFETFSESTGRWYRIHAYSSEPLHFITSYCDITAQKAAEDALREQAATLQERVKEMNLLIRFTHLVQDTSITIPEILGKTVTLISASGRWPDITEAMIEFRGHQYKTAGFQASPCSITASICVFGEVCGLVTVSLPEGTACDTDQAFLPEEQSLLLTLSFYIARHVERVESQEALRLSEARYRTYLDSAPDGIFVVDEYGWFREVNPAGCSMLGYSEEELLGLSLQDRKSVV